MPKKSSKGPSINDLIADVHKNFGDEAIADMTLLESTHPSITTGFANVDAIIGTGGLPKGRLIELFGPEHSGKSTLAIHAAGHAQKEGLVLYVDFEHSFDPRYAKKLGIDVEDRDTFLLTQPPSLQEGMSIAGRFIRAGVASMVIVDSIAAGVPQQEIEGDDIGGNRIGLHSLVWANVLKQITHDIHSSDCIFLGVNQVRTRIGVTFGSSQTTPGGNAWKHYASLRLKLVKEKGIKGRYTDELGIQQNGQVAMKVRVETAKNKLAAPFRQTTLHLRHGEGFDVIYPTIEEAILKQVVTKTRQGWIQWGKEGEKNYVSIRGDDAFHTYLNDNPKELVRLSKLNAVAEVPTSSDVEF